MVDYSIFDSLLDSVFVINSEREIVYCNEAGASLAESSVRRLTRGKKIFEVFEFSDQKLFLMPDGEWGRDEATPYTEIAFKLLASGNKGRLQLAIQPFKGEGGKTYWVVINRDVTLEEQLHSKYQQQLAEQEKLIAELREARSELEKYSKNLEKMVAERTAELNQANTMLQAIMNSLGQGFVVLNQDGRCGDIYTRACLEIFGQAPEGVHLSELLKDDEDSEKSTKMWIDAVFGETLPFESLVELAPSYRNAPGQQIVLDYYPILDEQQKLTNVVMVATDKTAEFQAKLLLEKEREQVKMILNVIRAKEQFQRFMVSAQSQIKKMIEKSNRGHSLDTDEMFRLLHTLEGESGAFSVHGLRLSAREAQEKLEPLRSDKSSVSSQILMDFRASIRALQSSFDQIKEDNSELFSALDISADQTSERSTSDSHIEFYRKLASSGVPAEMIELFEYEFLRRAPTSYIKHFSEVCQLIAGKQGKKVEFIESIDPRLRMHIAAYEDLFSVMVHAFRNAMDHGLELPEERKAAGKNESGVVRVAMSWTNENHIRITVEDDGRGISPELVRQKVAEKGLKFNVDVSDDQLMQAIFLPGFSSRDEAGEFSGRGVGMDAIKDEVTNLGGRVYVESRVGKGS